MMMKKIERLIEMERAPYLLDEPVASHRLVDTQLIMAGLLGKVTYWREPLDSAQEWFVTQWYLAQWPDGFTRWTSIHEFVLHKILQLVEMERGAVLRRMGWELRREPQVPVVERVPGEQLSLRPVGVHNVYFAQDVNSGDIKIGTSRNVRSRVSQVAREAKRSIALLATMDGDREVEHALHLRFASARIQGEWFRPVSELLDYIAKIRIAA